MRDIIIKENSLSYECTLKDVTIYSSSQRLRKKFLLALYFYLLVCFWSLEKRCWQAGDRKKNERSRKCKEKERSGHSPLC